MSLFVHLFYSFWLLPLKNRWKIYFLPTFHSSFSVRTVGHTPAWTRCIWSPLLDLECSVIGWLTVDLVFAGALLTQSNCNVPQGNPDVWVCWKTNGHQSPNEGRISVLFILIPCSSWLLTYLGLSRNPWNILCRLTYHSCYHRWCGSNWCDSDWILPI
jgi:hypothetical protein